MDFVLGLLISHIVIMDLFLGLAISCIVVVTIILIMLFSGWRPDIDVETESFKLLSIIILALIILSAVALRVMGIIESLRGFSIPPVFFMAGWVWFLYYKERRKYLRIVVNYLNGEGFVITAYFVKNIG